MDTLQQLIEFFSSNGYVAVFGVLIACGFGLPIPEDITLVAGGIISGMGYTNVHVMFGVAMAGVLMGDASLFLLGKWAGDRILKSSFGRRIVPPQRYALVQKQFEKYGSWVVFMARFTPGLRAAVYFSAGLSRTVSFARFFFLDGFAALISVPIWVYLGYYGAHERDRLVGWIRDGQMGALAVFAVIAIFLFLMYRKQRRREKEMAVEQARERASHEV